MRASLAIALVGVACSSSYGAGDAPSDAGATPDSSCISSLAEGWSAVAGAESASAVCAATQAQLQLVSDPVAGADACTCACTETTPSVCGVGTMSFMTGAGGICDATSNSYTFTPTTRCVARQGGGGNIASYASAKPLPAQKAQCASELKTKPEAVTTTPRRLCVPAGDGVEAVCRGEVAVGFTSCIVHDGEVACPSGPFQRRSVAGDKVSLACAGCATCDTSITCNNPIARFFNDAACATAVAERPLDGVCATPTFGSGAAFTHVRYDATKETTCTSTPPASAAFTFDRPKTICCR